MLVSHRKRFIYTKTVKTASTSVEVFFEPYCMYEGEWTLSHTRDEYVSEAGIVGYRGAAPPPGTRWWNHMPAALMRLQLGEQVWNDYWKFCTVRDPFDKAASAFMSYIHYNPLPTDDAQDIGKLRTAFEAWLASGRAPIDRDKYLIDGEFCVDEVIRYENLHADLASVCERLAIPFDAARLPELKTGTRRTDIDLAHLYSPHALAMVAELYADELERFGYAPPC